VSGARKKQKLRRQRAACSSIGPRAAGRVQRAACSSSGPRAQQRCFLLRFPGPGPRTCGLRHHVGAELKQTTRPLARRAHTEARRSLKHIQAEIKFSDAREKTRGVSYLHYDPTGRFIIDSDVKEDLRVRHGFKHVSELVTMGEITLARAMTRDPVLVSIYARLCQEKLPPANQKRGSALKLESRPTGTEMGGVKCKGPITSKALL